MKTFNNHFLSTGTEVSNETIALFKKVAVSPQNNSFLCNKVTVKNYCIMIIESGLFEWKINNLLYKLTPNDLILVCPGVEMEKDFKYLEFGNFYKISLDLGCYQKSNNTNSFSPHLGQAEIATIVNKFNSKKILVFKNSKFILDIFNKLEEEFVNEEIGFKTRISGLVDELIISIYRLCLKSEFNLKSENYVFEQLTTKLKNNLAYNWTVKEMAELSNMGVTKFSNLLKTEFGFSPFDYLIYLRINEAIRLLRETNYSVTSIALDTGFYSSQHFSNTFKKNFGDTPSSFRKKLKRA